MHTRASFTLIELLIVIAIVAVLSVVVLVTLNPVELLRQARDSTRISDLDTINRSLSLFTYALPNGYLGDPNKIYVSVPDPNLATATGTCTAGMGLSAPPGYTYVCASSSTFTRVNSTGWIPVDFTQMIGVNAPLSRLPTDPTNTTSSGFYYTYIPGGSWALTALLQSEKYLKQNAARDGGLDTGRFEVGNDLALVPKSQGLVGYWKFDDGGGTVAADSSGNGNNGTLFGSPPSWVGGKVGGALSFNGSNQYVQIPVSPGISIDKISQTLTPTSTHSIMGWLQIQSYHATLRAGVVGRGQQGSNGFGMNLGTDAARTIELGRHGSNVVSSATHAPGSPPAGVYHVAGVYDGINGKIYVNGIIEGTISFNPPFYPTDDPNNFYLGRVCNAAGCSTYSYFNGLLDEIKIYNRALTAAEVLADYNATK